MENKYKNLIIETIKQHPRFIGNEHLLDTIYDDTVARLGGILDSVNDESIIKSYVERISKLSIITVSRNNGGNTKQTTAKTSIPPAKEIIFSEDRSNDYNVFNYDPIDFQTIVELTDTQKNEIKSEIQKLEKEYPTKEFIKLYRLRYQENKTIEDISDTMNVSQAQAAERLFEITALVKRICSDELSQV